MSKHAKHTHGPSPRKAKKMLKHGKSRGKALTGKQKRMLRAKAGNR